MEDMDMDTTNVLDPLVDIRDDVNIIGVGAIGSNVAMELVRLGIPKLIIWDTDIVEEHNITNQAYTVKDIGELKTDAIALKLKQINPDVEIVKKGIYTDELLSGYVFICVDSIETRRAIVDANKINTNIKAVFDYRMGTYEAQHYATVWNPKEAKAFKDTMDFTDEQAEANVQVNACGSSLSVLPTILMIVSAGVSNFIKVVRNMEYNKIIVVNTACMDIQTM
jgi:molybdopterin/thiamine biosynthesis adenylyltransferase